MGVRSILREFALRYPTAGRLIAATRPFRRRINDVALRCTFAFSVIDPVGRVKRNPKDLRAWGALARRQGVTSQKIHAHRLYQWLTAAELADKAGPALAGLSDQLRNANDAGVITSAIEEMVRWKTIIQCREGHAGGGYYAAAEPVMEAQWNKVIWPIIQDCDFTNTLELAPGHGRNTELLRRYARVIHLVDVNQSCLDACHKRFGEEREGCRFFYHLTDGNHLAMIPSQAISFGYSWDSMVHFDKLVMHDYLREFARVLSRGGRAFLHHSNYGAHKPDSDWATNYGTRSDMSADLFRSYAEDVGLKVVFQRLSGISDGWGMDDLDCLSVIERPS